MSLTNSSAAPSRALQPSDTSRSSSPFDLIAPETPATQGDELAAAEKHPFYYFRDGNMILSVEGTLYNIHRYFFERDSSVFRSSLEGTPATDTDTPLVLADITCSDFDEFLSILYPTDFHRPADKTTQQWASILHLADKWGFESIRLLAVDQLDAAPPVDKIVLGRRYGIAAWLPGAYEAVCTRDAPLTVEEGIRLGVEDVVRIAAARQAYGCGKPRFETRHLARDVREIFGLEGPSEVDIDDNATGDEDEAIRALEVEVAYAQVACAALPSPALRQCSRFVAPRCCGHCTMCEESLQAAEKQLQEGKERMLEIISRAGAEDKLSETLKDKGLDAPPAFRALPSLPAKKCLSWAQGRCNICDHCTELVALEEQQRNTWTEEKKEKERRLKELKDRRQQRQQELADKQERKSMFQC
ncbi:hypothetical protein HWV62_43172 [Athelia sp. TMB]|nr:hypothetical protein HWV62_43172 [Athelia sp. TMB]